MIGGGAGSILDMIVRLRNNRNMLRKRNAFAKAKSIYDKKFFLNIWKINGTPLKFKSATKEQLALIKKFVKKQQKLELLRLVIITLVFANIGLLIAVNSFDFSPNHRAEKVQVIQDKITMAHYKQFQFYMKDGQVWMEKKHWNNAAFQFVKALNIYPHSKAANYKLAEVYTKQCKAESKNCEAASILIKRLQFDCSTNRIISITKEALSSLIRIVKRH